MCLELLLKTTLKTISTIVGLMIFVNAHADIETDLNNYFNKLGYESNVTTPSAYKGQAAGYYSGGGVVMRSGTQNIQLMHIDLPSIQSGCGGIDIFGGGFSFISKDAIIGFMRKVMNNAQGYAMNLALETMTPQIAHTLKWAQKVAQDINSMNINSCEVAQGIVGGLWSKARASDHQICKSAGGNKHNKFDDYADAANGCGKDDSLAKEAMQNAATDSDFKKSMLKSKNLVWEALDDKVFIADKNMRELLMSISGTMIFDDVGKIHILPSLAKDKKVLKAILEGGTANAYKCDSGEGCLKPYDSAITIKPEKALYGLTKNVIEKINTTLQNKTDDKLTPEEQSFINSTKLPIMKFIVAHLNAGNTIAAASIAGYSEAIAKSILKEYVNDAIDITERSLSGTDYPPDINKQLLESMRQARTYIDNIKTESRKDIQELMTFINSSRESERETASRISSQLKDLGGG
jgi:conjugative transfer pilus assembly protein TraH